MHAYAETKNPTLRSNVLSVKDLHIDKGLNFQVTENDIVFLPCIPALGTRNISIWTIDGVIYPSTRLPHGHLHHYGGILVDPVTLRTESRLYECYLPVGNSIGVQYSIYLSIQPSKSNKYITRKKILN